VCYTFIIYLQTTSGPFPPMQGHACVSVYWIRAWCLKVTSA